MAADTVVCFPTWFALPQMRLSTVNAAMSDRVRDVFVQTNNPDLSWDLLRAAAPDAWVSDEARRQGLSLYAMWNRFAATAADFESRLLLVNDDVKLTTGVVDALSQVLDSWSTVDAVSVGARQDVSAVDPDDFGVRTTKGSARQGGMNGWCFLLRAGVWPREGVDPEYRIWYGDDDLWWKLDEEGHQLAVADGITVEHATSSTCNAVPWRDEALAEDSARWAATGRP